MTVVTGFLGAGKTTLVNAWLAGFGRGEIAVIVNELGAVGIDGELLAARARTIVEITGGCVCCGSQAELVRALEEIAGADAPPVRVLVETSGAASPAGVLRAVSSGGRGDGFVLDGVVTVLDATRADAVCEHALAIEQIGYADIVVLSRVDLDADAAERAAASVSARNGAAVIARAARGVVLGAASLDDVLGLRSGDLAFAREVPPVPVKHDYESIALTIDGDVDGERFADFMETVLAPFAGRLFRTKGILAVSGVAERVIVQGVADTAEIDFGVRWGDTVRTSRLVVVGYALDRAALVEGFARCAV